MIADERHGDTEPRSAIDYIPGYNRYSDRIVEDDDQIEYTRSSRTVEGDNGRISNASPVQQPTVENEWTRS